MWSLKWSKIILSAKVHQDQQALKIWSTHKHKTRDSVKQLIYDIEATNMGEKKKKTQTWVSLYQWKPCKSIIDYYYYFDKRSYFSVEKKKNPQTETQKSSLAHLISESWTENCKPRWRLDLTESRYFQLRELWEFCFGLSLFVCVCDWGLKRSASQESVGPYIPLLFIILFFSKRRM